MSTMTKMSTKTALIALLGLIFSSVAFSASELEHAADFLEWLEKNAARFGACEPEKSGESYVLCDQTKVSQTEIKKMFALKPLDLIASLKEKGLKVELVCAASKESPVLGDQCVKESSNKMFAQISSLHGKYLPDEKTILIRNSASPGSLIHEYIHFLQSQNENKVYGKVYKKERNVVQRKLVALMDRKITQVQELERSGKKGEAKPHIQEFMLASEAARGFALWQDLIDERGIFLLYLKFGREFGASENDLALAKKNMGFICKNPKLTKLLPQKQCE